MTTPTPAGHERYADWDGAYVLGALAAAERSEFEQHLARCPECARAVSELASLPGLLGRVGDEERRALLDGVPALEPSPPPGLEHRILAAAQTEQRARRRVGRVRARVAVALVAAAVVAVGVAVPVIRHQEAPAPTVSVALRNTASPLSAEVALTTTSWGTKVEMTCVYAGETSGTGSAGGWGRSHTYGLYVVDRAGHAHLVSSWHAGPGQTARTDGSTDLAVGQVDAVQVRAGDGTTVLLSADL